MNMWIQYEKSLDTPLASKMIPLRYLSIENGK